MKEATLVNSIGAAEPREERGREVDCDAGRNNIDEDNNHGNGSDDDRKNDYDNDGISSSGNSIDGIGDSGGKVHCDGGDDDHYYAKRQICLNNFKAATKRIIGADATEVLIKVLANEQGIYFTESSGPNLFELKRALQQLIGTMGTRIIIQKFCW